MLNDLIARVAQGDRQAFDALYQATSARLNALCLSVLRDRREAEETLEQAYIAVWKNANRFRDSGLSPMAWLMTQTRELAMDRTHGTVPFQGDQILDGIGMVRAAYLQGIGIAGLAERQGLPVEAARHQLHEGLSQLDPASDSTSDMLAAELALGLADRRMADTGGSDKVRDWQERLARFADDLTPVMAPARARQRIREHLGHGAAPLSVDPLERAPWWRGTGGIVAAILLIAAAAWYLVSR